MPSVSLHLVLADRVLDGWQQHPKEAPFDPADRVAVNAFYQGALGPDWGYFPGGYRLLSDLAHRVRSVDLTRRLLDGARTPVERAFAWGWVTHVLGDREIHPLVGLGVGEFVHGDRSRFVDGMQQPAVHVRIETGLDTVYLARNPRHRWRRMNPVFDGDSVRYLRDAYRDVYGVRVDRHLMTTSHLSVVRMSFQALVTTEVLSRVHRQGRWPSPLGAARWILEQVRSLVEEQLGMETLLLAYLNPVPPSDWLMDAVDERVERFADRFREQYETRLAGMENFDLDTGRIDRPGRPSAVARGIVDRLNRAGPGLRRISPIPLLAEA